MDVFIDRLEMTHCQRRNPIQQTPATTNAAMMGALFHG
jgi:hypothetical protein